jgi:hypothetical protein
MQLSGSLSSFRNKIKETAEVTTKAHIETVVLKRFKTCGARAKHIREMFEYSLNREHDPFLWRRWEVTDIPTGYQKPKAKATATKAKKTARVIANSSGASKSEYHIVTIPKVDPRVSQDADYSHATTHTQHHSGYFVSSPIIETLAVFYEFNGIRADTLMSDPKDKADRPIGVLALAATAVTSLFSIHGHRRLSPSPFRSNASIRCISTATTLRTRSLSVNFIRVLPRRTTSSALKR